MLIHKDEIEIEFCLKALERNEVFILPCDTVYGFTARVPEGEARIRAIKGREETKPFLQLAASAFMVESLITGELPEFLSEYWPGPLTVILPNKVGGTTAFRVPDDTFLRELSEKAECPLYSTSVNRSGHPPIARIEDIIAEFESETTFIVDGGNLEGGLPSTLIDASSRPFQVLRQGELILPDDILL